MCSSAAEKPKKKSPKKLTGVLFTCYLFLIITCACLLTALVLIGKHLNYRVHYPKNANSQNLNRFQKSSELEFSRLPNDTKPLRYTIVLRPNLSLGSFEGVVDIEVEVKRKKKEIVLHSKNLTINTVELSHLNSSKVFGIESVKQNAFEQIVIRSREFLLPDLYKMHVVYSGNMLNKLVGLYRSKVKGLNSTRYMATSKFEPTYARQAFPCFDEPNMKASYKVTLLKPADVNYIALSNYPEEGTTVDPDGVLVEFAETVKMSTYLSCFIVSDFKYTETTFLSDGKEVPFRVYASPEQLDKTTYAGEVGKKAIEYFIDYFKIPYPLPKLDMVAVPDFVSGAMEHWGLVTFRETSLLYDESTHSETNKQRVVSVVAHELAHSWFGNLVTMDWWDNLWLNEGFATYITYKGMEAAEPDWNIMSQFQIDTLHSILSSDATQSSHPIIQTVLTPDQITEVFDSVSYNKGGAILRMLESVVTPEKFAEGVTNYLNAHEYGNAVTQDLWDEIQKVVNDNDLNITEFMDTFTVQMGYPILNVKVDGNKYTFTQKRFLSDPESASKQQRSSYNYKWNVPITYITDEGEHDTIYWFKHNMDQLTIEVPETAQWIKFNPNQVGYYRVNYVEADWSKLQLPSTTLSIQDRAHLIEESFSIAESGELDYSIPLSLTELLKGGTDYVPWSVASSQLIGVAKYFQTSQYETALKSYVHELLLATLAKINWNEVTGHALKLARRTVLNLACRFEYESVLTEATNRFNNWLDSLDTNAISIEPDIRDIVYKYGMQSANQATWDKVFNVFNEETDANEKLKLLNGLANVRNPTLLYKLIELAKDETYVRGQDYFTLLQYVSANPIGRPIVWDYVRENWDFLVNRFTLNNRYLGSLIPSITSNFLTKTKLEEMERFFADNPDAGAGAASRRTALENVKNNIKWVEKNRPVVENWLNNRKAEVSNL